MYKNRYTKTGPKAAVMTNCKLIFTLSNCRRLSACPHWNEAQSTLLQNHRLVEDMYQIKKATM
jgi:hypothetical protein